jgi:PAS domain S-box-containing protein
MYKNSTIKRGIKQSKFFLRLKQIKAKSYHLLEKIYDPGDKGGYKSDFSIWPVRPIILVFLVLNFHFLNKYPLLSLNVVTIPELVYGVYIFLLYIFSSRKLTVKTQLYKLILDLLFVSTFEFISISLYGNHSGLYVIFITPVIYCSYWFRWYVTFMYVNIVATIYCLINYHLLNLGIRFTIQENIRVLGPIVVLLYLVAAGGHYYKEIIKRNREQEKRSSDLGYTAEFTQNLLESSFDAIIAADEEGMITNANERAQELLGYESEDIAREKVDNFYAKGEAQRVMEALTKSENGSIENFESLILTKSGEQIPILLSAAFLCDKETIRKELARGKRFSTVGYFKDLRAEIAIDKIAKSITSMTSEEEIQKQIVENVAKLLKAEACGLLTFDESIGEIRVVRSYGMPRALKLGEWAETYGVGVGMIGRCFSLKNKIRVSNIDVVKKKPQNRDIKWEYARNFAKHSRYGDFKHFLGVPLEFQGEVYGVIRVLNKYSNDTELDEEGFTPSDEKLLERISTQVSILVEKVRDKDRFEAILKVGRKLNEMLDVSLEEMLATIAKDVVNGMRFKACYLRLIENGDTLRIKACCGFIREYMGKEEYDLKLEDGSITANVVKSGKYRPIKDLSKVKEFKFPGIIQEEKVNSMLSMPLNYRGRVIGVINCYTRRIHKYTGQEIQIMETFAAYATTAIQNKRRVDEFKALNEISAELVKPIELDELFNLILEKARTFSGADRLCLKIYDDREKKIKTTHSFGCPWHANHPGTTYSIWEESPNKAAREVYKTGKSKIVDDYDVIREHTKRLPDYELMASIQSCALVPVTIDERVYGLIFLESDRPDFFTEDDLLVLEAFSSQAAIALKNANFLNKLQRVYETFPSISELNVDIDRVLENIADIAAEVLETDALVLFQYDEKNKKVEVPPIVRGSIRYPQYMDMPLDENDAPYLFIKRGTDHFANKSLEDPIMESSLKPRKGIPKRFLEREEIVSSAGILLRVGKEIVGIMFVNYRNFHKFDDDERKIILNYASYIAIAIQNVRHFREKESLTALDSVQRLAASLAHKMKNDIGAIHIDNDRLLQGTNPERTEYKILSRIEKNIKKITTDIDSLLRASRLQEPEMRYVNFRKLVRELESEILPDLGAKNIKYNSNIADDIPELKMDPLQIKMVLSNLVNNSIDAMPDGGDVTLSIKKEERDVIIHWQDTGPGIPEENALKIFDAYHSTKGEGFGVGLFLSKRVIEEHGGSIALDTINKKGAKFIIRFPIKEPIR